MTDDTTGDPNGDPTRQDQGEIDRLVERAVATLTAIARRAGGFATRLAIGAIVVCGGSFLLGVAALDDGIESVWIVLGIVFGTIAVGSAVLARWRVGSVRRHAPALADDVRALVAGGRDNTRTVIESFVVDDPAGGGGSRAGVGAGSVVVFTRRLSDVRGLTDGALESTARLSAALTAITSFPALVLVAVAISLVFAGFGAIFLLALAIG